MSMDFFSNVLQALGKKLNYESISNLYGNSFAIKDAQKYITEAYPLMKKPVIDKGTMQMFDNAKIYKIGKDSTVKSMIKNIETGAGDDFSYLEDMFNEMLGTKGT